MLSNKEIFNKEEQNRLEIKNMYPLAIRLHLLALNLAIFEINITQKRV